MLREATCWTRKTSNYLKKSDPSSSVSCAAQITQVKMGLFLNCLKIASISSLAHRDFVAFFFFSQLKDVSNKVGAQILSIGWESIF